jgi:diguanylate cyclase (GGDEF)-like protein
LILEIKGRNEIRKSTQEKNVLTCIAEQIKKRFRTSDIIGRLGLSEFIVYMRNIPSDRVVYEIAQQLCESVEGEFSYSYLTNGISISIGITLHQGEQEYKTLYTNANTALVMAKKVSSSSFEVLCNSVNS